MKSLIKSGFTLVELIVVIVILAILSTIAFLSFSSQSSSARDSTRLADMSNIAKGLSVNYALAGKYPRPDLPISIMASGVPISLQGYAGTSVLNMIKISSGGGTDPLDGSTYYTYSTNADQNKFQILGFLEDGSNTALSLNPSFAKSGLNEIYADSNSYSGRYVITKGDQLGILLDSNSKVPAQTLNLPIDIITTSGSYVAQLSNTNKLTGSGNVLKKMESIFYMNKKGITAIADVINGSLIGFWDMETLTSDGKLKDLSGNGVNGVCVDGIANIPCGTTGSGPQLVNGNGRNGKALFFDGNNDYINLDTQLGQSMSGITIASIVLGNNLSSGPILNRDTYPNPGHFELDFRNWWQGITSGARFEFQHLTEPYDKYVSLVVTFDGTSGKTYVNGVLTNSGAGTGYLPSNAAATQIGKRIGSSAYFKGNIDEIKVYNRALSNSEIQDLYNSTK